MTTTETDVPRSGSAQNQPDNQRQHDADRHQRIHRLVDAIHPPFEQRGNEDDDDDLGELGRLDAEPADTEPAGRTVDRDGRTTPRRAQARRPPSPAQITTG